MKNYLCALISCFVIATASAQTVTDIVATYHDGQLFITWTNIANADTGFYYVYKNNVPITAANIQSSVYLGRVPFNFGYDYRFTYADPEHNTRYLVTNDNPFTILTPEQNLFVMNCTKNGAKCYFAVRSNFGSATENWTVIPGLNATNTLVKQHLDPVKAYLAQTGIVFPDAKAGETLDAYVHYGSNVSAGIYPAMTNEGCLAFHFGIIKTGPVGGHNSCFIKFHGGQGDFIRSALDAEIDSAWKVSFDDWMPSFGLGDAGYNTRWLGYNENFDVYHSTKSSAVPTSGVIHAYTINRNLWELGWIEKNWPGTIDTNKIYLNGSSQGCAAVFLHTTLYPSKYAAAIGADGKFNMASPNDDNPDCKYNDDKSGRTETRVMWGNEDSTNLLTDIPMGSGNQFYRVYNLTNMNYMFNNNKDVSMPFLQTINGKNDNNTCWEEKVGAFASIQKYNVGGLFEWDMREHGGGSDNLWVPYLNGDLKRYRTNLTYPAFASCTLDGYPGDTNNPLPPYYDGDTVGSLHGNIDFADASIIDAANVWEMKIFIKQDSLKNTTWIPVVLPEFATANITIRRAQHFKGFPNNTKLCWTNIHDGSSIQSGVIKQNYSGGKPKSLTIKNVKVYGDTITLHVEPCSGLKATGDQLPADNTNVYPNPFTDQFILKLDMAKAGDVRLDIFNVIGERIYSNDEGMLSEGIQYLYIQTADWSDGMYVAKVTSNGDEETYRIIKQR